MKKALLIFGVVIVVSGIISIFTREFTQSTIIMFIIGGLMIRFGLRWFKKPNKKIPKRVKIRGTWYNLRKGWSDNANKFLTI